MANIYSLLQLWGDQFVGEVLFPTMLPFFYKTRTQAIPAPESVKKILIWNLDSLGDLLMVTPTVRALKAGYPNARVTLICNDSVKECVEKNPSIDELIPIRASLFYNAFGFFREVPELRGRSFDLLCILEMGVRPADKARLVGRKMKIKYIVSGDFGLLKQLSDYNLPRNGTERTEYWPNYFLGLVRHLGLKADHVGIELHWTQEDEEVANTVLRGLASDSLMIGLHPCVAPYANRTKKWPADHFIALGVALLKHLKVQLVVTGDASEREECERIAKQIQKQSGVASVVSVAGLMSIRQFAAFLSRINLLVVGDTASLHIASAVGMPVVALFGATNSKLLAQESEHCRILTAEIPCRPCHQPRNHAPFWPTCVYPQPECLLRIKPQSVFEEVFQILDRRGLLQGRIL